MRMSRWSTILLIVFFGLAAACDETPGIDDSEDDEVVDAPEDDEAVEEDEPYSLTVALHFTSLLAHWTGLYVAQEEGFYEEEGLDVEFILLGGSSLAVQTTGTGEAGIGLGGSDALVMAKSEGLPITAIANQVQITDAGIVTLAANNVNSLEDLQGKRISTSVVTPASTILEARLGQAGLLSPEQAEDAISTVWVDNSAMCTVMLAGQADACTGYIGAEFANLSLTTDEEVTFFSFSTAEEPLMGHVTFANDDLMRNRPDVLERFLTATYRGYKRADEDVEQTVDLFAAMSPDTPREYWEMTIESIHELMRSDLTDQLGWGAMSDDGWMGVQGVLLAGGLLDEEMDVGTFYTNQFLPDTTGDW